MTKNHDVIRRVTSISSTLGNTVITEVTENGQYFHFNLHYTLSYNIPSTSFAV